MELEYSDCEGVNKYFIVFLKCIFYNQKYEEKYYKQFDLFFLF